jgi:hypothetical protein
MPALAILVLVLNACAGGNGLQSSGASATPSDPLSSPNPKGSPSPTAAPSGIPGVEVDGLAEVVTNDLVVRSTPEISDDSIIDPLTLFEGIPLFVLDGPVTANGYL